MKLRITPGIDRAVACIIDGNKADLLRAIEEPDERIWTAYIVALSWSLAYGYLGRDGDLVVNRPDDLVNDAEILAGELRDHLIGFRDRLKAGDGG